MPQMRKRLRSELSNTAETKLVLSKIAGLYAQSHRHVVFEVGTARFNAADCTSVVIDPTLVAANIQFKRPGGASVENYDIADIQIIRRLRVKKWLIRIKFGSNPA